MNIAITGVSGFVGKNLKPYLQGKKLNVIDFSLRNSWVYPSEANVVIHLAGKAHDTANTSTAEDYFKINRDLTIQVYEEFLKSDTNDFFYFSSVKAVADTVTGILTEEVQGNPQTPYGKSKLEAENYLLSQKLPEGKRLFIIRPCMIHGPGNKGNLNLLYKVVKNGIPWPLASFDNRRSFLSIDNLSYLIYEMVINSSVSSGIYNFSDDESISTNTLIEIISNVENKHTKLLSINKNLIIKLAKCGDLFRLPLNSERLKKLTESYESSNLKIKKTLGLKQLPIATREGLFKTIQSFNIKQVKKNT